MTTLSPLPSSDALVHDGLYWLRTDRGAIAAAAVDLLSSPGNPFPTVAWAA